MKPLSEKTPVKSKSGKKQTLRPLRLLLFLLLLLLCAYVLLRLFSEPPTRPSAGTDKGQTCQIGYLLNLDGMKGLGHSALLLVDESGAGQILSYNGMQYNLFWCLLGKEGVGKMKVVSMTPAETEEFLDTGRPPASALPAEGFDECRDFDRILYRPITREQYDTVLEGAQIYIEAGEEYERLYAAQYEAAHSVDFSAAPSTELSDESSRAETREQLEDFLTKKDIPKYQIYSHNCDTAARCLIALVDSDAASFNTAEAGLFPKANYRKMCRSFGEAWGYSPLGEDSLPERLLP